MCKNRGPFDDFLKLDFKNPLRISGIPESRRVMYSPYYWIFYINKISIRFAYFAESYIFHDSSLGCLNFI